MRYSVFAGGKRLRSLLALASCHAVCGTAEASLPLAASLEFVHTFSLIRDDLPSMDDDDYRRGKLACHRAFDEATALLAGDALLTLAFETLASDIRDPTLARTLLRDLAGACGVRGMASGQAEDLDGEGASPSEACIARIHAGKATALIRFACVGGGRCGGATADQMEILSDVGLELGHAFQIIDDLLDATAAFEQIGKPTGRDRQRGKMTYLTIEDEATCRQRAERRLAEALLLVERLPRPALLCRMARDAVRRDR